MGFSITKKLSFTLSPYRNVKPNCLSFLGTQRELGEGVGGHALLERDTRQWSVLAVGNTALSFILFILLSRSLHTD